MSEFKIVVWASISSMAGSNTRETIDLVDDYGLTIAEAAIEVDAMKSKQSPSKALDDAAKETAINALGFEWGYYLPDGTEED